MNRSLHLAGVPAVLPVVLLIVAAACTAAGPTGPGTSPGSSRVAASPSSMGSLPGTSNVLVLRASYEGGFVGPNARRSQIPLVSVFADGRIMSAGAVPAIYPGPLLPIVVYRSVGPSGAAAILRAAIDAGLSGADATYQSGPPVPDAPATLITVVRAGRQTVSTFAFLGPPGQVDGLGSPQPSIEAAASALLARLTGNDPFGGTVGPAGTYQPLGFQLYVTPGGPQAVDPGLARPPVAWPLSTSLATFGRPDPAGVEGARVGVVSGAAAAVLDPVLAAASQLTGFTSGGAAWTIVVRPLLPDEVAALGG